MQIRHRSDMVSKFAEIMMNDFAKQQKDRTGLHRSDAITCPLKAYWRLTGKYQAIFTSQSVGILLIGTLAHLALHKNFNAQEEVHDLHGVTVTIDAITEMDGKRYPIESKTCYDDQTEVLTENGWKLFKDLTENEKVMSMNPETNEGFFIKPSEIVKQKYSGKIFRYESQSLSIAVTPNHQMLVRKRDWRTKDYNPSYIRKNHKSYKSAELISCNELIGKNEWYGIPKKFKWIRPETNLNTSFNLPLNPFLQFLGWFIAEGYVSKSDVAIAQKDITYHRDIETILNKLGFKWTFSGDKYHIWNKELSEQLKNICYEGDEIRIKTKWCCYNKIVPKFIKTLSPDRIKLFLDEYWKGDGSFNGYGNKKRVFHTTSKKLANDIQELILKSEGYATITKKPYHEANYNGRIIKPNIQGWIVSEWLKNREAWINPIKGKMEDYDGYVYCAIVEPYHTLLVRRNNKPFWCGNTRKKIYGKDQIPQEWFEQLAIAMGVINADRGYLMILNVITYSMTVWEISMSTEEREMFLNGCIWQVGSILDAIKQGKPELLQPKYDMCDWCPYKPSRSREDGGCPFYKPKPKKD